MKLPGELSRICTPEWFSEATAAPVQSRGVEVDGVAIHYLSWNGEDTHKPGLLFAHGFRAHARWWSFVAPFFLSRFRVVALDFAGMGDSGQRAHYDADLFSRDIVGVIEHAQLGRATLVGHSFGGGHVARTCADYPQRVERAVLIDSYIPVPGSEYRSPRVLQVRPKRVYPTFAAARERFRLVPGDNCAAPYVLDYVGRHSMKQVAGGWTWKFDEQLLPHEIESDAATAASMLARVSVPATFIHGDLSAVVTRAHAHEIVKQLKFGRGPIAIAQAHHHVMLDQPLALVAALQTILY